MRLLVATPSTGFCRSVYAVSLAKLTAYFASVRVDPNHGEQWIDFDLVEGSTISSNRDTLVDRALAVPDLTHLLFIDEDMQFAPQTLHVLARRKLPLVGCNYRKRKPPAEFTALGMDGEHRVKTTEESTGLEEVLNMGFGFCLIDCRVLKAIPRPRFLPFYQEGYYSTEDFPFFLAARKAGFPAYVDHDASKLVAHKGDLLYEWHRDYAGLDEGRVL